MRVVDQLLLPGFDLVNVNAKFFLQFALQRLLHRLTRLEFATGKLPVAGVDLVSRARRQQKVAVRANQHTHRHVDHGSVGTTDPWQRAVGHQRSDCPALLAHVVTACWPA
jgi:hypothetical protein